MIIKKLEGNGGFIKNRNYKIVFRNTRFCTAEVKVSSSKYRANCYAEKNNFIVELKNIPLLNSIEINCIGKDIEISAINLINDDIANILDDLEIETTLKEKVDTILFSELSVRKKRIEIRKLRKYRLELKFQKLFIKLLEYIDQV